MLELQRLQKFFCKAMSEGWASGNDGSPSKEIAGFSEIHYSNPLAGYPDLLLVDCWGTDPASSKATGYTTIFKISRGSNVRVPLWAMWYGGGSYPAEILPFLRAALMDSYSKGRFHGGRGPDLFEQGNLTYTNDGLLGNFARFSGREAIIDEKAGDDPLGFHEYWGGSLVYLK